MSKEAKVGAFAILALLLLFGVFFIITDFATRHTGYRVGVHFNSAAGLRSGALIYFSGVTVGTVDSIVLLPDNTVDVVLAVNRDVDIPRDSKFLIQAPLTGDPSLVIVPPLPPQRPVGMLGPTPAPAAVPVLERKLLPVDQQPQGTNTATIADLLEQGQGEVKRLDIMLADLQQREPRLLNTLQNAMNNANALTVTANRSVQGLSSQASQIATQLQSTVDRTSANVLALTGTLNSTVAQNSGKVNTLLTSLNSTAVALNQSVDSLRSLATNREMKQNILDTTRNIAQTTQTIAYLTNDLRQITGNPQTQNQVRDTVANLDATMQKANSLLGTLGGQSKVYGVDTGATPYPVTVPAPSGGPLPATIPGTTPGPVAGVVSPAPYPPGSKPNTPANIKKNLGGIIKNLYAVQIRIGELSPQRTSGLTNNPNPLLSSDRGPQTDFNLLLLPKGTTSFLVGANDIGARSTLNFAALSSFGSSIKVGGGVLYSRLGILGQFNKGPVGLEGRLYDLRRPTLDAYINANVTSFSQFFFGERDITHPERRTVFGLQLQF
ncbi:MAG: MlaD family protein [Candidatus Eremiobacteraeota bacterium]|nr:MlaD family protein [Candidatus Eremiobacteraeota bacterium]